MNRTIELEQIFAATHLPQVLSVRRVDYLPAPKDYTTLRFESNEYRVRAIEIWDRTPECWFRIYHSPKIAPELKNLIDSLEGFSLKTSTATYTDYFGDSQQIAVAFGSLLVDGSVHQIVKSNPVVTRNSAYEGLTLPDVDVTDTSVLGRTFTWKELIAIEEDTSDENELKRTLSRPGVYLQRSQDGKTRYVGSAYGDGGILGRWLRHLTSNGSAKHLNIYVLENGYANVLFTVLEFTDQATAAETRWKETLGTRNAGPYDGLRLNSN